MALKTLLVAFSTTRTVDGEERRVRFKSGSVVDLTEDEMTTLDSLTEKTGKLHYRAPVNEGGKPTASEPEVVDVPDYAGQDVAIDKKTVDQLKAYLTFHSVVFDKEDKAGLVKLAQKHEAGQTDDKSGGADGAGDLDGGL